ncbi:MAG: family 10 glycosylhydrolase [Candidatus Omnitrophica bacterium]|nr:family 10 glycosylhydrolase [Candidatus Omnitrophota bacterium]MDD5436954.1 family 10 glycosylhydrolase [Candidatus Omnitrophota bacterium]
MAVNRIGFYVLCVLFLLAEPAQSESLPRRGLFVSMIQEPSVLARRADIDKLLDFAKKGRVNILFVQTYRANQAYFPSRIADPSPYRVSMKNISQDPLRLLIKEAHRAGIEVHAWLNMLSLGENKDAPLLKKYGTGILTRNAKRKKRLEDYEIDEQYFLEPGDMRVRKDLCDMVGEILVAYPELDGIEFDYVRYPDEKPFYGYTKTNITRFKGATGIKKIEEGDRAWKDWKRAQVTECMELFALKARGIRPRIQISATGCMPYSRAYHEAFQDWPSWLDRGLLDFVTVMDYSPDPSEFNDWIAAARTKTKNFNKVNIGVGAYKLAGSPKILEEEFRLAESSGGFACTIFHYGSLVKNPDLANLFLRRQRS